MLCKHSRKTSDQRNLEKFLRSFFELYGQPRLLPFRPVFLTKTTFRDRVAPKAVKNHKPCDISPPKDLLPLVLRQMTVNIWYWNIPLPDFDQEVKKYKKPISAFSCKISILELQNSIFDFSAVKLKILFTKRAPPFFEWFFFRVEKETAKSVKNVTLYFFFQRTSYCYDLEWWLLMI